jgi:membrane associated rhomboid family serine protease
LQKLTAFVHAYPASSLLLFAMVLISVLGLFVAPSIIDRSMLRPYWLVRRHQYLTLVASGFVHANLAHLFFNAFTFWAFAFPLERLLGSARLLELYAFGLLISDIGTVVRHRGDPGYQSLGASGAILAVLFASILYFPKASLFILPIPIAIPAPLFAVAYLAYSYYASRQSGGRVNHDAHLSGAVAGVVFVALTDPDAFGRAIRSFLA